MPDANSIRYGSDKKTGKTDEKKKETKLKLNFRPLGTKICIQPISGEMTTASGLIIPDNAGGEKPQEGWVLAVGPAVTLEEDKLGVAKKDKLKPGDRVLFSRYAGDEIRIKDEKGVENEFKILHFESLLGVVESDA